MKSDIENTHILSVPLEASRERALVLVDESQGVAKLMHDSGAVHKPQVHGEALFGDTSGVRTQVRP